jgi:hypothetical protein
MASTSRILEAHGSSALPSVQEQLTELQNQLQRMRVDCEQYMAQEGMRAEEKERLIAEKEAVWEQLRMDISHIVDDGTQGGRAARRPRAAEGTIAVYML